MTETELKNYIAAICPADRDAMAAARQRQAQLAKPPGRLGALEDMSVRLAGVTGRVCPPMNRCRVAVFAADNGVVDEGVSCAPRSVTVQQAVNMTRRKTGMSAMAAAFGDDVAVVDVGMDCGTTPAGILNRRVRRSTGDIGNTSTSAAVLAVLTGADIETVTGRGGGLTDRAFARKKDVLRTSVGRRPIRRDDAVDVLCAVGGLDIAAMTGAFLGCAHEGIPAAVDGFISVTAALCAVALCPAVRDYLFLSHDSYEVGYRLAAERLGLEPCLHLGMRLGEGSGCPLLFRVMEGACGVMSGMATFAEAAIHDGYLDEIRAQDSFTVDRP